MKIPSKVGMNTILTDHGGGKSMNTISQSGYGVSKITGPIVTKYRHMVTSQARKKEDGTRMQASGYLVITGIRRRRWTGMAIYT